MGCTSALITIWDKFNGYILGAYPTITSPATDVPYPGEVVTVTGNHKKSNGHFWLVTKHGRKHWLHRRLTLNHEKETWKETINIGANYDKSALILLVKVDSFTNSLFSAINARSPEKGKEAVEFDPPFRWRLCTIRTIDLPRQRPHDTQV